MQKTALILGASGGFGGIVARELESRGWKIKRYVRGTDMNAAAQGADLIVNGLNPPNYHNWAKNIPAITKQVIAAATASGARVLIPGNVYNFGRQPGPWTSKTAHVPVSRKGAIRAKMEQEYRDFVRNDGGRVLIIRCGDFMAELPNVAINKVMLSGIKSGKVTTLGDATAKRAWAWLPDVARAAADLLEKPDLANFVDMPFAGHTFSQADLVQMCQQQLGKPIRVARFPEWTMTLAAPFWELARELREMMYLWQESHSISEAELQAALPDFKSTPMSEVLKHLLKMHQA